MLYLHKMHSETQKAKISADFKHGNVRQFCVSLGKHVYNKPESVGILLAVYATSSMLQVINAMLGSVVVNSIQPTNVTTSVAAQSAAMGVLTTYMPMTLVHELTTYAHNYLDARQQNLLKHMLAISHDLVASIEYTSTGAAINKQALNVWVNFGAVIVTVCIMLMFLCRDQLMQHYKNNPAAKPAALKPPPAAKPATVALV